MAENGNGNGTSKLVSILPTVLAVIVTVFFGLGALLVQAMAMREENSDLKLQLAVTRADCEVRVLNLLRDQDRVRVEIVEERLNTLTDVPKKKEP